jgi:cell division protein FtsQ
MVDDADFTDLAQMGVGIRPIASTALVLLGVAIVVFANIWKGGLRVGEVTVSGNAILPTETIVRLTAIDRKEPLFEIDLFETKKRILENPFIKEASVRREAPACVSVHLTERVPIAAIGVGRVQFIDAEGYVLPPIISEGIFDVPVVTGNIPSHDLVSGDRVQSQIMREVLSVIATMRAIGDVIYRRVSEINVTPDGDIVLVTTDGTVPVLIGVGEYGRKLATLVTFWDKIAMRSNLRDLEVVDLRYEGQVVVRWKGKRSVPGQVISTPLRRV